MHTGVASAGVFRALGVAPELGRVYTDDEDHAGGPRVAVISDALWRRRFNSDPHVLGQPILLNDSSTVVIGVMPPGYQLPLEFTGDPVDLWVPLALGNVDRTVRGGHYLNLVARLRAGVTERAADQGVQAMARHMVAEYPAGYPPNFGAFTRSVTSQVLGDVRPTVVVLTTAVGFVLLIACANVANLLLARAFARQREMAVRASLGASQWQIMRQLLTEAGLLAGLSGSAGILVALLGVHLVAADAPRTVPRIAGIGVDVPVLLFALLVTIATGLVCGILPALHAARTDLHTAFKETLRGAAANRKGERARRALIVAEVAMSVMLLVGAGLLTRSFVRLLSVSPGFDPADVVTAHMSLPVAKYPTNEAVRAFYRDVAERARVLPGVASAALVRVLPMTTVMGDWSFRVEGRPVSPGQQDGAGDWQVVSEDYFRVMRIRLMGGRLLRATDDERAPGAVLVNEALASRAWPDGSPIGQRIRMGGMDTELAHRRGCHRERAASRAGRRSASRGVSAARAVDERRRGDSRHVRRAAVHPGPGARRRGSPADDPGDRPESAGVECAINGRRVERRGRGAAGELHRRRGDRGRGGDDRRSRVVRCGELRRRAADAGDRDPARVGCDSQIGRRAGGA